MESVSPETPNDAYQALLSIYSFASRFASGSRVLDLGCGCGQGSRLLLDRGAAEVVGVDLDRRVVRYASRRFAAPGLEFRVADAESLPADLGRFDLVVSSNVFEHLSDPEAALGEVVSVLGGSGAFILAVPPIVDAATRELNEAIRFHRSNLAVEEWRDLLRTRFDEVDRFAHLARDGVEVDLESTSRSSLVPEDFRFEPMPADEVGRATLTALFRAARPTPAGTASEDSSRAPGRAPRAPLRRGAPFARRD
jgi:SAM-dependent methyltransferase